MPVIESAKKRMRTNEKRRMRNMQIKSAMRTAMKKVEKEVESGDVAAAKTAYREAAKRLDKAVKSGVIHKNKAARHKSKLAKKINELGA